MRRREFLAALGGAGALPVASPIAAWTQERVPRIGILVAHAETDRAGQANVAAFRDGLQKLGWIEGRNIRIETRGRQLTWACCSNLPKNSSRRSLI